MRRVVTTLIVALPAACGGHAAAESGARAPVAVVDVAAPAPPADAGAGAESADTADAAAAGATSDDTAPTRRNPVEPDPGAQDVTAPEYVVHGALVRAQEIVLLDTPPDASLCGIREGDAGFVMTVSCALKPGNRCAAFTMKTSHGAFVHRSVILTVDGASIDLDSGNGTNVHGRSIPVVTCP